MLTKFKAILIKDVSYQDVLNHHHTLRAGSYVEVHQYPFTEDADTEAGTFFVDTPDISVSIQPQQFLLIQ